MLNLRAIDLNLLPVFEAAYEEGSLSGAARRLSLTQPAVSHALARLRATFRDELFVRQSRGMRPTPAADALYARVRESLALVRMSAYRDRKPAELSGGQQQRVAIARTLMMQPDCVLFDEPTSALDPVMASEVLNVITDLARQHQTMIVVTHSMGFARGVATRVHVFAGGYDVENGPPSEVLGSPKHEVTKSFLAKAGEG